MLAARMTRPTSVVLGEVAPVRSSASSATRTSELRVSRVMLPSRNMGNACNQRLLLRRLVSSLESKLAPFLPAIKLRQLRTVLQVAKLHFPHIVLANFLLHAAQVSPGKFE